MRAVVVIFPGSNRERDVCAALALVIGREPVRVWHRDTDMPRSDLIVLPGGFAYGDYLRCGAMAAHSPIMHEVRDRAAKGTPILGICNGFQILAEAGMLPGALLPNRSLRFTCRDIHLRVENNQTIFTCGYAARQTIRVPVAHHDGNYTADPDTLDRLEDRGLVAFRYCGPDGDLSEAGNFNGSARAIAGIFNNSRTVLGLMPHLENAVDPLLGGTDGRAFFEGLVGALQ
ncbi:MAG TPA: phosphoribosylformylglycinamidine synthase subunit PurQ [Stellaceae bacterium]|jgi:phosphoribosylformylglycinamidine synthase|nr:phosphoribosylformylglycinamidine synthase subunit PurQ [Stellaceae bacterium]